jgi:dolichyl-phosphate-mannose-protein mannosyltransferase
MFTLAYFIGIYSYLIFFLGLFGVLYKINIFIFSILWLIALVFIERKNIFGCYKKLWASLFNLKKLIKNPTSGLVVLFLALAVVNFIGALGPELAFDALWYHLTLPKLYLLNHSIYHIPGGLLYYSDMPKLGEMLYVGALSFGNTIAAKIVHYLFGILVCIVLYKISRKFFTPLVSWLIIVIFYSNLVVDTESITAYIDLIRTFFEVMTLWAFLNLYQSKHSKWLIGAAIMTGLAVTTKVLGIGSIFIFSILLVIISYNVNFSLGFKRFQPKSKFLNIVFLLFIYCFIALLIPLPWLIFSFIHTGNPVYPFFTQRYEISPTTFNPIQFLATLWNLFMYSPDPISPVYLIFLPLLFIFYPKFQKEMKIIVIYCALNLILWYFTPQTGGGRFILPYLPAFSLICGSIYSGILKKTRIEWKYVSRFIFCIIIFVAFISVGYRFIANSKYIPVLIGKESQEQFLTTHLNFSFGDFYDTDGYFASHMKSDDRVLLFGFHNLYYVDFPFIDSSWVKNGNRFDYIASQNEKIPTKFKNWQLIYLNARTGVKLYRNPASEWNTY